MVKLINAPVDVSYTLLFTGMELLAHKSLKILSNNLPQLIKKFCDSLDLPVTTDEANQIAAIRNAMFHRGEYEGVYQHSKPNEQRPVKLADLPRLQSLFPDVLLKVLGFDDPHINWNRWRDRMAFKQ